MLVLTRKVGDSVLIDGSIKIQVVKVKGCQVRLGIEAPKETKIFREEVLSNIKPASPAPENLTAREGDSVHQDLVR